MPLFTPAQYELLPSDVQAHALIHDIVRRTEMAVIDRYTDTSGTVELEGYDADPLLCDPDLLERLHYAIADVVTHVATLPDTRITTTVRGSRMVVYKKAIERMPSGWDRLLAPYDTRTPDPLYRI